MMDVSYAIPWIGPERLDLFADGKSASALIFGWAGYGKSVAAHFWLARLMARGVQVVILNGAYRAYATDWLARTCEERGQSVTVCSVNALPSLTQSDLVVGRPELPYGKWETWFGTALKHLHRERQRKADVSRPLIVLLDNTGHPNYAAFAPSLRATTAWKSLRMHLWLVGESLGSDLGKPRLSVLWEEAGLIALFHQEMKGDFALRDSLRRARRGEVSLQFHHPLGVWGQVAPLDAQEQRLIARPAP